MGFFCNAGFLCMGDTHGLNLQKNRLSSNTDHSPVHPVVNAIIFIWFALTGWHIKNEFIII